MNLKKFFALILAILLGIGVLSPLLYTMSYAASSGASSGYVPSTVLSAEAAFAGTSNNVSRIRKNYQTTVYMDVMLLNYVAPDDASPEVRQYDGKGSFAQTGGGGNITVTVKERNTANNFTVFSVGIPVKYSGKGNSLSFDLIVDPSITLRCTGTVPIAEEYSERDDDDEEKEKEPDPLTPYIIVESYKYGGDSVIAGNDFILELTLRNTSDTHTLQNIVMNISPQGVFSMGSSSNTFYIPDLHAGSTMVKKIEINAGLNKITDDKDANSIGIKFDFQYLHDDQRKSGGSSENITIPVTFPDRFELSPPETGGNSVFQGEEWYIYVPMINKGRSSVNNIMAYIECEGLSKDQRQYVGNLQAGSESGIDFSFSFDEPGHKEGRVVVTYEDTNMNPKELSVPFFVDVEEMFIPEPEAFPGPGGMMPDIPVEEPEEENKFPAVPVAVTAVIVCAISAYITVLKAKAKRSIFNDEEI